MFLAYTIRNLIARRATVIPTMLAIITTVAVITIMQALSTGLLATIGQPGNANNAVVIMLGADSDLTSYVAYPLAQRVVVIPEVARAGGVALVSPEIVVSYMFRRPDGHVNVVNVRGIDPIAMQIHQSVKLTQGTLPANHALGCVLGVQQVGTLDGFKLGGKLRIGHQDWPVTGILTAPSTPFESEIWCDRTALMDELRTPLISAMYVQLTGPDAQDAFAKHVRAITEQPLDAFSERVHFNRAISSVSLFTQAVTVISLVLAIGAILACINAVYLAFLSRIRELSTLVAIGFTRWRIAMIALQESLLMTTVAGVIGIGLALAVNGRSFAMDELAVIYRAQITTSVLLAGVGVTVAIGVLGAAASVIHALRLRVLLGLRSL